MWAMLPAKPCLPTSAPSPPVGPEWLHEIKHDGYRMLAHHDGARVRLISRRGLDWGRRFPTIVAAIKALAVRSCIVDGELIACDANGLADFQLLRWRKSDDPAIYCAFDLIEVEGRDLRNEPIEERKAELGRLLGGCQPLALVLNRTYDDPGPVVFEHACKLGCEGIVSKRRGSLYARGRSSNWLKVKNPDAPAVRREREEHWGG
jgi:ATP-dependent DNA ligase